MHLKGLATLVHSQQISYELAGHLQGRAIGMPTLQCVGMQRRQLRVPAGSQFRGLDQHRLQPRVALFGNRPPFLLASRRAEGCGCKTWSACLPSCNDGGCRSNHRGATLNKRGHRENVFLVP
jgi:hypothetical protein